MANRSRQTFLKRQKERARQEKQRLKAEKRQQRKADRFPSPARVVPRSLWDNPEPRVIVSGLRTERASDGELLVARELIPGSDEPSSLELPERLGGGFLFYTAGSSTQIFRAKSWTAPLEPLATVEMRADRIEAGFDRLYLLGDKGSDSNLLCLNAADGKVVWTSKVGAAHTEGNQEWKGNRATPTLDGKLIVALGAMGELVCFDMEGKEKWRRHLHKDFDGRVGPW